MMLKSLWTIPASSLKKYTYGTRKEKKKIWYFFCFQSIESGYRECNADSWQWPGSPWMVQNELRTKCRNCIIITLVSSTEPLAADRSASFLQAWSGDGLSVSMHKGRATSTASWLPTWKDRGQEYLLHALIQEEPPHEKIELDSH